MSGAPPSRREALSIFGASAALAVVAGCDSPDEFGHPLHGRGCGVAAEAATLATQLELDGLARGVLVRLRGGHPIKIEGNPLHPASLGASDAFMESAPLSLHDPGRSRRALHRGRPAALADVLSIRGGRERLLTGPVASPTVLRLIEAWMAAAPDRAWHVHNPMADQAEQDGARAAFGADTAIVPLLAQARVVLCFGADPLGHGPAQLALARAWADHRPRLLVAEATPSLTGARAELRLALPAAEAEALARAVAGLLGLPGLARAGAHPAAESLAAALREAGPGALVLAGRGASPATYALAHATNAHLGSTALRRIAPLLGAGSGIAELLADMRAGRVPALITLDSNPAYDLPGFAEALVQVRDSLHIGQRVDETAVLCTRHAPLAHPLECWGDGRAFDGTPAVAQPAAVPDAAVLAGPVASLLALLGRTDAGPREAVRETWRDIWGVEDFETRWETALERGVCGEAAPALDLALREGWDRPGAPMQAGLAAVFVPDPHLRAGGFAHEAWLQEMPRPLTGLAWGNAVLVPPSSGLAAGEEVEITAGAARLVAPALPVAGQAEATIGLPLGFGRRAGGPVGEVRGFDAGLLRPADGAWVIGGVSMRRTGRRVALVSPTLPALPGPPPVRVLAPGEALAPIQDQPSLHAPWPYPGHAWGMSIDLDACIGCNACAAACQAENNVPVVGPQATAQGRTLHWLRVDRHALPDGRAAFQPVPCMHCEKAPCEPVCPVNATVHDHEGLNGMVYARCIGTRTCANACPYGVRRFNWEDHRRKLDTPARNTEVPLRPRGVMEKCTYCTHRIQAARLDGRLDELQTACQRACPTQAIRFGDLNDAGSAVAQARRDGRAYRLLDELGTRPRTFYLARVEPG